MPKVKINPASVCLLSCVVGTSPALSTNHRCSYETPFVTSSIVSSLYHLSWVQLTASPSHALSDDDRTVHKSMPEERRETSLEEGMRS